MKFDSHKIERTQRIEIPASKTEVRRFLALAKNYHRFIGGFYDIAVLFNAAAQTEKKFHWTKDIEDSLDKLHKSLITPLVLPYTDLDKPFIVQTDMSKVGLGAVFAKSGEGLKVHPIHYASKITTNVESNYNAFEREYFAVLFTLWNFRM